MEWMKPQKTMRAKENGGEHHMPMRTWARKQDIMQERMRERENDNVSKRELWRSKKWKWGREAKSVKVKTV